MITIETIFGLGLILATTIAVIANAKARDETYKKTQ